MPKDWKDRLGVVFSTSDNYDFDYDDQEEEDTLDPKDQRLYVFVDRKQRKGKAVTIVEGFVGLEDDLKELGKTLKTKCGTGGSVKDGEIIIQGDNKKKVYDILLAMGYSVKMKG
jgi:translation initiation factor 1